MKSWRLDWTLSQWSEFGDPTKHRAALRSPWKFWLAVVAKFVPRLWPFTIDLPLSGGGTVPVDAFMTLYIFREIFVDGCYDVPLPPRADPLILDVGANTGLFMLRMKQLHPNATIRGYEPLPANVARLARTIAANRLTGCEVVARGVGGRARRERLYVHPRNIGGNSIHRSEAGDGSTAIDIDVVDIADELQALEPRRCQLLKLDCEGAEHEILLRLDAALASRVDCIVYEPTRSAYDPADLANHLRTLGYRVEPFRGLVLARRVPLPDEPGRRAVDPVSASSNRPEGPSP